MTFPTLLLHYEAIYDTLYEESGGANKKFLTSYVVHITLIVITLLLALGLLLYCRRKASQHEANQGSKTTYFLYCQTAIGFFAAFCFLDLCEYAAAISLRKKSYLHRSPRPNTLLRFQADISAPAKAFSYFTDVLVLIILMRIGFSLNNPRTRYRHALRETIRHLSYAVPLVSILVSLSYISCLCNFVSSYIRGTDYGLGASISTDAYYDLLTALLLDLAFIVLIFILSCTTLIDAIRRTVKAHGYRIPTLSSGHLLYLFCSVLWLIRALTQLVCIISIRNIMFSGPFWQWEESSYEDDEIPGWQLYFLNVIFATWPEYLILHLFITKFDAEDLDDFFVIEDIDMELLDTVSNASSDYS